MNTRAIIYSMLLFLSGCSTTPTPTEPCLDMAKYAKSVAFLISAGIDPSEIDEYTKVPVAINVPIYVLQAQVINANYKNPGVAYAKTLERCETLGWRNMLSSLRKQYNDSVNLKMSTTLKKPK